MLSDETIIKTGRFLGYANMVLGLIGSFMLASKFGITYRRKIRVKVLLYKIEKKSRRNGDF